MIRALRAFFILVLVAMLSVTIWAGRRESILAIPAAVTGDPWFIATLFDAYFGFLTFFIWVAYKETSWLARAAWLIAILVLGNIAMAVYALLQLFRVPADARLRDVLLRKTES